MVREEPISLTVVLSFLSGVRLAKPEAIHRLAEQILGGKLEPVEFDLVFGRVASELRDAFPKLAREALAARTLEPERLRPWVEKMKEKHGDPIKVPVRGVKA